ncbi:MAG TPA: PAS domain S-box protein, partial [Thermodesulfovibrionales bacterium]|nr:PAS domain S-box protein [Thermodesulfovibrionales bacterium]
LLIETTDTGYVIIDDQGRVVDANQEYVRLTGRACLEEIKGHSVTEWTAPHDRERNAEAFLRCVEQGFVRNLEIDYLGPSGAVIPVEINASVLRTAGSLSILSVCRDITDRRKAQVKLSQSMLKYRTLFDFATDAIFILDLDGKFIDVNRIAYTRLGYTKKEMLSMNVSELDPPEFAARVPERLAEISRHGQAVFESAHRRKDGSVMPVEVNCRLLNYEGRKVYFSIIRDITERKQAETLLRASEEQFRVIVDTSQVGIILVDPQGTITFANNRMAEMFGMRMAALIGTSYPEHLHETEKATGDGRMRQLIRGEIQSVSTERHYIRADGTDFWGYLSGKRLENPDGTLRSLVGIIADITDRKQAEQERLMMERRFLHAQKLESLGILAGGIAHDFNNLLMAILGNLDIAMLKLLPDSSARENIEQSAQAALRAADLTRQMLAYSGRGRFIVEALDLNRLVEENANLFRAAISRATALRLDLTRPLPLIEADAGQIQQVIMNLLTNASEAIAENTGVIALTTGSQPCDTKCLKRSRIEDVPHEGNFVYLEVSDTGAGMDEQTQQRMFDPFFTTKTAGRGLGMSAILGIVRGHHGAIFIDSAAGGGTTIRILFPAMAEKKSSEGAGSVREATLTDPTAPAGTVLVVDDEEIVRNICTEMVGALGMQVLTASDGRHALEVFRQNAERISLVILDITMPVMDGITAFRELVRIRPGVKIILSSGYDDQDSLRQLASEGLAGFIKKTVHPDGPAGSDKEDQKQRRLAVVII